MTVAVVRAETGIKTLKDVINAPKPVIVGSNGAGAVNCNLPAVLKEVLNANSRIITGYGGTADIRAAMERSEVDGNAGWSWSSVITTAAHLLEKMAINVLVYYAPERNGEMKRKRRALSLRSNSRLSRCSKHPDVHSLTMSEVLKCSTPFKGSLRLRLKS